MKRHLLAILTLMLGALLGQTLCLAAPAATTDSTFAAAAPAVYLPLVQQSQSAAVPTTDQISQYNITWTFDRAYPYGQFANGDYWVVGPVTVTAITPASAVFPDGSTRHGSMLNPAFPDSSDLGVVKAVTQGYDSRPGSYDAGLNVALGVSPSTPLHIPANNSLVSAESYDTRPSGVRVYLKTAAVLTVLEAPAPAGSFRPPFSGTDKTVRHNQCDLDYSKLRRLSPPDSAPSLTELEPLFQRPWIDTFSSTYVLEQYLSPHENLPDYGREFSLRVGNGALALNLDYTNAQKEKLLISYIQVGIDLYGVVTATDGGRIAWYGGGGHRSGRKLPILFAGWLLDDNDMQNVQAAFAEDMQIYAYDDPRLPPEAQGIPGWTGAKVLFKHSGTADGVAPSWDDLYEHKPPSQWTADGRGCPGDPASNANSDRRSEAYRTCCTGYAWVGMALTAHLMDLTTIWNKPEFLAYEDRWMQEDMTPLVPIIDAGLSQCGYVHTANPDYYGRSTAFQRDMWALYRDFSDTTAPAAPTTVSAAAISSKKITVTWTRAYDNIGGLRYQVFRDGVWVGDSYSDQFVDAGLSPVTPYSYTVRAVDSAGNPSNFSSSTQATTWPADNQPPSAPGNLRAVGVSPVQIVVRWDASTDNVGVTGYRLSRDGTLVLTTTQTYFFDTGRTPGATHDYVATALDADENQSSPAGPVTASTAPVKPVVVPEGLQAYWRMDETDGEQLSDASGHGRHGMLCDGATWVPGKLSGGLSLDGVDDHAAVQGGDFGIADTLDGQYSVAAWIWISRTATTRQTFITRGVGQPFTLLVETDGKLGAYIRTSSGATTVYSSNPLPTGSWQHVALTYQDGALRLYVNGSEEVVVPHSGAPTIFTSYLTIGSAAARVYPEASGQYFGGRIDDLRIYNRVLTPAEIDTIFNYQDS